MRTVEGVKPGASQPLNEALEVAGREIVEATSAKVGNQVVPQDLLVAARDARFVGIAAPVYDRTVPHSLEKLVPRLAQRHHSLRRSPRVAEAHELAGAPDLGFIRRSERLCPDIPSLAERHACLERRNARAAATVACRASAPVTHVNSLGQRPSSYRHRASVCRKRRLRYSLRYSRCRSAALLSTLLRFPAPSRVALKASILQVFQ